MIASPHIGNMLRDYVTKKRIYQSGWARQQGLNPTSVARYLKRPTMQVDTLFAISQTLQHNFLREISDLLPPQLEPQAAIDRGAEVEALQQRVQQLETQVATLKEALALVGRRG
jgi:cell shape-determining protein MreC